MKDVRERLRWTAHRSGLQPAQAHVAHRWLRQLGREPEHRLGLGLPVHGGCQRPRLLRHRQRHRWNGTAWDDGGTIKLLATGWTGHTTATARYRMTVDGNNHIYRVTSGGDLT